MLNKQKLFLGFKHILYYFINMTKLIYKFKDKLT